MSSPGRWFVDVRERVNAHLELFFERARADARATSPEAVTLVDAVAELTMRGGKRLRPAALHAAFVAVRPGGDAAASVDAAASLELLQSYFLIQDDWMDRDLERRGGPSVHAALGQRVRDPHLGASLAILAADLASGFAWELASSAPFPAARLREALAAFGRMHFEVVCGQQLDLLGHEDVSLVHQLKTGSYTVRGPLRLGALLGDANAEQLTALERFGEPLGLAFQLRDDLLSAFGDARATGKPVGNDLKAGKRTALLAEARARLSPGEMATLDAVFGNTDASDAAVAAACDVLLRCGAREHLEARLAELLARAHAALHDAPLQPQGLSMLRELADKVAQRSA